MCFSPHQPNPQVAQPPLLGLEPSQRANEPTSRGQFRSLRHGATVAGLGVVEGLQIQPAAPEW